MTPIKIEPNSGTKMSGIKVRAEEWKIEDWVEIMFVGQHSFMSVSENLWGINRNWYLYEEPKAEVKKVLKPVILANDLIGGSSLCVYNANPHIKPARVVLKNIKYETVDLNNPKSEIVSADLYLEVEE